MNLRITSVLLLICFLGIRISHYSDGGSDPILTNYLIIAKNFTSFNLIEATWISYAPFRIVEFALISSTLLFGIAHQKKIICLVALNLLLIYWILIISYYYSGLMDISLYMTSSIPFVAMYLINLYLLVVQFRSRTLR